MAQNTRIDKLFSDLGIMSRSECKKAVKQGKIAVGGVVCRSSDEKCDPDADEITLDGSPVDTRLTVYYMMNKPAGVITASEDPRCETVMDFVDDGRDGLAPVGRLDKDTTGFLLITNDGQLNHKLLSPRYHVPKTYRVLIDGILTASDINRLEKGLDIGDDKPTLPAKVEIPEELQKTTEILKQATKALQQMVPDTQQGSKSFQDDSTDAGNAQTTNAWFASAQAAKIQQDNTQTTEIQTTNIRVSGAQTVSPQAANTQASEVLQANMQTASAQASKIQPDNTQTVLLTITEGRFHQVKRMFEAVGKPVLKLHRQSFGPLLLDPALPEGSLRELTEEEIEKLIHCTR